MMFTSLIPAPYRILATIALGAALVGFGWVKGAHHVQAEWDAAEGSRAQSVATAYQNRLASNQAIATEQARVNDHIQKEKDHEIAALTARVNAAGRLRVGPGLCGGPAATSEAQGAAGGDSADPPGRLVSDDADRDFKALIIAVETDLATGRACQAFLRENGLVP